MEALDFFTAGFGVLLAGSGIAIPIYYIGQAYKESREALTEMIDSRTIEKLVSTYADKLNPKELKEYVDSFMGYE